MISIHSRKLLGGLIVGLFKAAHALPQTVNPAISYNTTHTSNDTMTSPHITLHNSTAATSLLKVHIICSIIFFLALLPLDFFWIAHRAYTLIDPNLPKLYALTILRRNVLPKRLTRICNTIIYWSVYPLIIGNLITFIGVLWSGFKLHTTSLTYSTMTMTKPHQILGIGTIIPFGLFIIYYIIESNCFFNLLRFTKTSKHTLYLILPLIPSPSSPTPPRHSFFTSSATLTKKVQFKASPADYKASPAYASYITNIYRPAIHARNNYFAMLFFAWCTGYVAYAVGVYLSPNIISSPDENGWLNTNGQIGAAVGGVVLAVITLMTLAALDFVNAPGRVWGTRRGQERGRWTKEERRRLGSGAGLRERWEWEHSMAGTQFPSDEERRKEKEKEMEVIHVEEMTPKQPQKVMIRIPEEDEQRKLQRHMSFDIGSPIRILRALEWASKGSRASKDMKGRESMSPIHVDKGDTSPKLVTSPARMVMSQMTMSPGAFVPSRQVSPVTAISPKTNLLPRPILKKKTSTII